MLSGDVGRYLKRKHIYPLNRLPKELHIAKIKRLFDCTHTIFLSTFENYSIKKLSIQDQFKCPIG